MDGLERQYETSRESLAELVGDFASKWFGSTGKHREFENVTTKWDMGQLVVSGDFHQPRGWFSSDLSIVKVKVTPLNADCLKAELWRMGDHEDGRFGTKQEDEFGRAAQSFLDALVSYLDKYLRAGQCAPTAEPKKRTSKAKRGPQPYILDACRTIMELWLSKNEPVTLREAIGLAGTHTSHETVRRWIPNVLEIVDEPKRREWIKSLDAIGEGKHLGKFRPSDG